MSGGEGDEMQEVPDAGMQAHAGMEPPPVQKRARKRRRNDEMEEVGDAEVDPPVRKRPRCLTPGLFDLPPELLKNVVQSTEVLECVDDKQADEDDAHKDHSFAVECLCKWELYCIAWTRNTTDRFKDLQQPELRRAQRGLHCWDACVVAQTKVEKLPRQHDLSYRQVVRQQVGIFVTEYCTMLRRRKYGQDVASFKQLIEEQADPVTEALCGKLGPCPPDVRTDHPECQTKCPREFDADGIWTAGGISRFVTRNSTVQRMMKEICTTLQKDVDVCRESIEKCQRKRHFATEGFREFLLQEQALAQRRKDEEEWRINRIFLIV